MGPEAAKQAEEDAWEGQRVTDQLQMVKEMLNDDRIPEWQKKALWGLVSKTIKLSNIGETDERIMLREFDILTLGLLNSMNVCDINSELLNGIENLRPVFRANLTRAKGDARERKLLAEQIVHHITTNMGGGSVAGQPNVLKRAYTSIFGKKNKAKEPTMQQLTGGNLQ